MKKSLCLAMICNNNESTIIKTLNSIYKYINYWIISDTGSNDNTCELIKNFFIEKKINGKLFEDNWKGINYNKTLLFKRCFSNCNYIFYLKPNELIISDFNFSPIELKDSYYLTIKKNSIIYNKLRIFNSNLNWNFHGIKYCVIKVYSYNFTSSKELISNYNYIYSTENIFSDENKKKFIYYSTKLKKQFLNTLYDDPYNLNNISVFYTAQCYMNAYENKKAIEWFNLYLKLKNNCKEKEFECNLRIMELLIRLKKCYNIIKKYFINSILIFNDRSEPYYIFGKYYNDIKKYAKGYELLKIAKDKNYKIILTKYNLCIREKCYGKYINDELSISCYGTNRFNEGLNYLKLILNDSDFNIHKNRLLNNNYYFKKKLYII